MDIIFDTALLPREARFRAWQENICDIYVHVDAATNDPLNYYGKVRSGQFGSVTLTDNRGGSQVVSRHPAHLAKLDKDCVYIQFVMEGEVNVVQAGVTSKSHSGAGSVFNASEPYDLIVPDRFRSLFIELPWDQLALRLHSAHLPRAGAVIPMGSGLGRIAVEFCHQLTLESHDLDKSIRASLGDQAIDIIALAMNANVARALSDQMESSDRSEFAQNKESRPRPVST